MHKQKQTKGHRQRQQAVKAARCRKVAINRGERRVCPLIDVIADFATISDKLPWPSQQTMAHEAGVDERTIRRWLVILEGLGILDVWRSTPRHLGNGKWTRNTNRYLLCDYKAMRVPWTSPLVRRRSARSATTVDSSPTGHQCPVTLPGLELLGVATERDGPPTIDSDSVLLDVSFENRISDENRALAKQKLIEARAALTKTQPALV